MFKVELIFQMECLFICWINFKFCYHTDAKIINVKVDYFSTQCIGNEYALSIFQFVVIKRSGRKIRKMFVFVLLQNMNFSEKESNPA